MYGSNILRDFNLRRGFQRSVYLRELDTFYGCFVNRKSSFKSVFSSGKQMIDKLKKISDCKGKLKQLVGDEGVLQLAKLKICPHYILINPITNEEHIYFDPAELNEWFVENYCKYNEGGINLNYNFHYFDKDLNTAKYDVPIELSQIKDLFELSIEQINTPPGIYFLCLDKKIQYIGKSVTISDRVISHIKENVKQFDKVFYVVCPLNELDSFETALIRYYKPPLNKTYLQNPDENDLLLVKSIIKKD